MVTKYNTGQQILIPATIRSAREDNGKIIYEVDTGYAWDGIPEDQIVIDDKISARAEFEKGIRALQADFRNRF